MIQVGKHRFVCGDITQGAVAEVMGGELADVVYTDPPWGPGLLRVFASMAEPGTLPRLPWLAFLDAFARSVAEHRKPHAPVFVEMGTRWVAELDAAMMAAGLTLQRRWITTYGSRSQPKRATLTLYGPRFLELQLPDPPHGEPVTLAVLTATLRPGSVVLDPCTGLGRTGKLTARLGGCFRGTELNQARLDRAIAAVRKEVSRCA